MNQLDRIEAKLDWLRWRMRWGEMESLIRSERDPDNIVGLKAAVIGPDPGWPEKGDAQA